jgi:hypothetical protein
MKRTDQKKDRLFARIKFHKWVWIALLAIILLTIILRIGLLNVPLERDEGEYAYGGQLILQHLPIYRHLYSMKLPGIYLAYAGILMVFGQTHTSVHFGLLLINIATIVAIFLLAKRLINFLSAAVAAASFAVLSANQSLQGVFANSEHFVILPAVFGALLLLKALEEEIPQMMFYSGLLFGIAFIMKQHGILFAAFGAFYLLVELLYFRKGENKRLRGRCFLLFSLGVIAPYGLTCIIFSFSGDFKKFWFLTFEYAKTYATQIPLKLAWKQFKISALPILRSAYSIWIFAGFGLTALFLDKRIRKRSLFIAAFVLFSFMSICPGFYFRPHYFILFLPAAALLSGIGVNAMANMLSLTRLWKVRNSLPVLFAVFCLAVSVYQQRIFLFQMTPVQASRSTYGLNPFPEALEISKFIQSHSNKDDQIAVLGSEPEICFYSKRISASGYIYMYPLMETHPFALQMQKEMIAEIESAKPKYLIFANISSSWLERPGSHQLLFKWFLGYQKKHYTLCGFATLFKHKTIYHWAPKINVKPASPLWIAIFERRK